jgi:Phage portal protein, SPP1 Gp6-like
MTIEYINSAFPPPPFDDEFSLMAFYRDLYEGNHENIFPRAQQLAKDGQITKNDLRKSRRRYYKYNAEKLAQQHSVHHYVIVNFASVISELPADLINRSLGNISADTENDKAYLDFVENVTKQSKTKKNLWAAIVQHQVDGSVAYRIRKQNDKTWFEWKPSDFYLEHDDGLGCDIAWIENRGVNNKEQFLRVERQRLNETGLTLENLVYEMKHESVKQKLDISDYARRFELDIVPAQELEGVDEIMAGIVANDETLMHPRGRSGLRNVDVIQEEINYTITRDSIVFEKHGKPKLAIPSALWRNVSEKNKGHYGAPFVRNADLEVVSYDEKNGAVPLYITWNAQTEQSFKHVTRLIDHMMAISKTSPEAAGINSEGGGRSAIAILYEWIQSVVKAEAIQRKFDSGLKEIYRKCAILENAISGTGLPVDSDVVLEWREMLPKADDERNDEEIKKYEAGAQSLEQTVRAMHPEWSEEAIQAEMKKIEEEKAVDSFSPQLVQPPKTVIGDEGDE